MGQNMTIAPQAWDESASFRMECLVDKHYKIWLENIRFMFLPSQNPHEEILPSKDSETKGMGKNTNTHPNTEHREFNVECVREKGKGVVPQ